MFKDYFDTLDYACKHNDAIETVFDALFMVLMVPMAIGVFAVLTPVHLPIYLYWKFFK